MQSRANADLGAHIQSLGLQTIPKYQRWCREHGFTTALNKGWQERRSEKDALRRDAEAAATEQNVLDHARALGLDFIDAY